MKNNSLIKDVELFLDDKPSVYALRSKARLVVEKVFFSKKDEAWKYTDVREIINKDFEIVADNDGCKNSCACGNECNECDDVFIKIKFCNGRIHIEDYNLPKGIKVVVLPEVLYEGEYKKYLYGTFNIEEHPFAALNGVYLEQGVVIEVEKGVKNLKPLVICYNSDDSENRMFNIHNMIILGKGSELEIVEDYKNSSESCYLMNVVNEFFLDNDSVCRHYKVQKESFNAYHTVLNGVKVYENANYKQFYLAKGSKLSRNETLINLEKVKANAEVYSMYIGKSGCLTDITTNINHKVKNTSSTQYAKAVLEENSKACFQGKVRIEKDAIRSVGNQLHKALYLGDGAELNCKPELEIYADDVKCSHGASSGEIDGEQLFYLTSRGIGIDDAKKMLIDAHLEEILQFIENEQIKERFFL